MINPKIADHHLARQACIYIRQSTMGQVRFNQESTERQYNLADQARSLGWIPEQIRILDRDLGHSGERATNRDDFKTLVSDVAMGQVGAIFSLEASRLALAALGLGDRHPSHRTGPVRPRQQLLADRRPRGAQMRGGLVNVQTIHTGDALVGPHPLPRPLQVLSRQRRQKQR